MIYSYIDENIKKGEDFMQKKFTLTQICEMRKQEPLGLMLLHLTKEKVDWSSIWELDMSKIPEVDRKFIWDIVTSFHMEEYLVRVLFARFGAHFLDIILILLVKPSLPNDITMIYSEVEKGKGVTFYIRSLTFDIDKKMSNFEHAIHIPWLTQEDLIPYKVISKTSTPGGPTIYHGYDTPEECLDLSPISKFRSEYDPAILSLWRCFMSNRSNKEIKKEGNYAK